MSKRKRTPRNIVAPTDDHILSTADVLDRIPWDRSTLWRKVQEGQFPPPIQLTPSRIGWRLSKVMTWLTERETDPVRPRAYFKSSDKQAEP